MNRVILYGNLGADPELKYTQGGQPILKIRMATKERYLDKDKSWKDDVQWHNVTVWGKRGEALGKFLAKGSTVLVEGKLRTSSYDDREGKKRYITEVVAINVTPGGKKGDSQGGGGGDGGGDDDGGYYDEPPQQRSQGQGRGQRQAAPPQEAPADEGVGGYGGDDDIPF